MESELRTAVEKRRDVSEGMWTLLDEEQKLKYALDEMEGSFKDRVEYLVSEIDRIFAAVPTGSVHRPPPGGAPYARAFDYLSEREWERMEVRAEVLVKHAASEPTVQAFRDRFLGGELLAPEQARGFVTSPANQNLPVRWFDKHGVSFKNHATDTRMNTVDYRGEVIEFAVQPAGIDCRVQRNPLSKEYGGGTMLSVVGDPSGGWRGFTGYVLTDSPLGVLRDLSHQLATWYRDWKSNYAARFVLTGEPPEGASPLWAEGGAMGEIVMHVAPWISPESVKNAYTRELWFRGWMGGRYGGSQAKRQRRLGDKTLKLLRFVTVRMGRIDDPHEKCAKGREVAGQWDAEHPEWAYRGDTRTMWRDYSRALQQVAPSVSGAKSGIEKRLQRLARPGQGGN